MRRPGGAAIVVAILFVLILSAVIGVMLTRSAEGASASSFSGKPEGALAFRRLLEQLDIAAGTFTRSWESLPEPGETLLIVATPLPRPPSSDEAAALDEWVREGGALLVVDNASLFRRPEALDEFLARAGLPTAPAAPSLGEAGTGPARPRLAGAHEVIARDRGLLDDIPLHAEGNFLPDFSGLPLAMRPDGAVVAASAPRGEGQIARVLGPLVSNDRLLQGDLLPFALRVVDSLRHAGPANVETSATAGRNVLFDEYHQGYGGLAPHSAGLDAGALAGAAAAALAASILVALARGARFGPPRVRAEASRRSGMEFVDSIAGLYRRAGFREHALDVALASFARAARLRFGPGAGLGENPGAEALARAVAKHSALDYAHVIGPLREAERGRHDPHLTEAGMTGALSRLSSLHAEVFHGR